MSRPLESLVGRKFGRWTVLAFWEWRKGKAARRAVWLCRCECGIEKAVEGNGLRKGMTGGCYPCSRKALRGRRGPPPRAVKCRACGIALLRGTHWRNPVCARCAQDGRNRQKGAVHALRIEQARRYRIVLHVLGWEHDQFEEMIEAMKASPMGFRRKPETGAARRDVNTEKRRTKRILSVLRAEALEPWAVRERFGLSRSEAERYAELARRSA